MHNRFHSSECGQWHPEEQAMVDTCAFWFEGEVLALIHPKGVNTLFSKN